MERRIIFKNTETGVELMLPVTPQRYPMAVGRGVEQLEMAVTGEIALPGLRALLDDNLEVLLPAQLYPFCTPGAIADPKHYLDLLTAWSASGDVCRYIVVGTDVNLPVLLGAIAYREEDGSNDVYATIPLCEYRYLEETQIVRATENTVRVVEVSGEPLTPAKYTVVKGDSLWKICRKQYGDSSLCYKLATANNIKNPNIIRVGQVLALPEKTALQGYGATMSPSSVQSAETVAAKKAAAIDAGARKNSAYWSTR